MSKSHQQLFLLIGAVVAFILLFSLCNPFQRKVALLDDPQVDEFVQPALARAVDILWVVDNSGSMKPYQENLARNFDRFIQQFIAGNELIDFRMAITTTDAADAGTLQGQRFLSRQDAQADRAAFMADFRRLVQTGIQGSNRETGLYNAWKTTAAPLQPPFFRPDALLVINLLTDENDQSDQLVQMSVLDFVNAFKQFKGGNRVMINAIVDTTGYEQLRDIKKYALLLKKVTGQDVLQSLPTLEQNLLMAARLTQGEIADIRGDFATTLATLAGSITRLASSFALSRKADDAYRMVVYVNEEEAYPEDWEYDPRLNVVSFRSGYVPQPGARVRIEYEVFYEYGDPAAGEAR